MKTEKKQRTKKQVVKKPTYTVEKSEETTLHDAINLAMAYFETFEGNIKRVAELEDETHYVFAKVRE